MKQLKANAKAIEARNVNSNKVFNYGNTQKVEFASLNKEIKVIDFKMTKNG